MQMARLANCWFSNLVLAKLNAFVNSVAGGLMFLTIKQLAERWQVSEDSVRRLIANGGLPAINLGTGKHKMLRVAQDDVDAFEERRKEVEPRPVYSQMQARAAKHVPDYLGE